MFHFVSGTNNSVTTGANSLSMYDIISSNAISTLRLFQLSIDQYFLKNQSNCFNTQ